jgi:hypothetical protein
MVDIFVNLPAESFSIETLCVKLFGQGVQKEDGTPATGSSGDVLDAISISRGVSDMR